MEINSFLNVGSIHDVPIGRAMPFKTGDKRFAVFRETYGDFYVFADENADICQGRIKEGKIQLPNGHTVDLRTGRLDESDRFIPNFLPWVENGFILFSLSMLPI